MTSFAAVTYGYRFPATSSFSRTFPELFAVSPSAPCTAAPFLLQELRFCCCHRGTHNFTHLIKGQYQPVDSSKAYRTRQMIIYNDTIWHIIFMTVYTHKHHTRPVRTCHFNLKVPFPHSAWSTFAVQPQTLFWNFIRRFYGVSSSICRFHPPYIHQGLFHLHIM